MVKFKGIVQCLYCCVLCRNSGVSHGAASNLILPAATTTDKQKVLWDFMEFSNAYPAVLLCCNFGVHRGAASNRTLPAY